MCAQGARKAGLMNTDIPGSGPAPVPLFVAPVALADGAEFIGPARICCGAVAEGRAMARPTVPVPRC
jgi:hypothetical protein